MGELGHTESPTDMCCTFSFLCGTASQSTERNHRWRFTSFAPFFKRNNTCRQCTEFWQGRKEKYPKESLHYFSIEINRPSLLHFGELCLEGELPGKPASKAVSVLFPFFVAETNPVILLLCNAFAFRTKDEKGKYDSISRHKIGQPVISQFVSCFRLGKLIQYFTDIETRVQGMMLICSVGPSK